MVDKPYSQKSLMNEDEQSISSLSEKIIEMFETKMGLNLSLSHTVQRYN